MSSTRQTVETLIGVASRLIALMHREVEFLRGMRVADIAPLQEEKSALTTQYEILIRALASDPDAKASIDQALRAEFVRVAADLEAALAENERAIHAARTAQNRLVTAIGEAIGNQRSRAAGYSASGEQASGQRHDPSRPLAFDARL